MDTPLRKDDDLLTLMLSGDLNGMDASEFTEKYFPAKNGVVGWVCFERWADARKDKVQWELFQIDPSTDPAAVGIAFAAADLVATIDC